VAVKTVGSASIVVVQGKDAGKRMENEIRLSLLVQEMLK